MNDLVTFLRACLDEDERVAQALAQTAPWGVYEHRGAGYWAIEDVLGQELLVVGSPSLTQHIARHDPARVLAEVAAKRAIVEWIEDTRAVCDLDGYPFDSDTPLLHLAAIYSDRPGYRSEWAPGG
jgi:hypothetical protein